MNPLQEFIQSLATSFGDQYREGVKTFPEAMVPPPKPYIWALCSVILVNACFERGKETTQLCNSVENDLCLSAFPVIMLSSCLLLYFWLHCHTWIRVVEKVGWLHSVEQGKCSIVLPAALNSTVSVSQLLEMYIFYFTVYQEKSFIALQTQQLKCSSDISGQWERLHVTVRNFLGLTKAVLEITVSTDTIRLFPLQISVVFLPVCHGKWLRKNSRASQCNPEETYTLSPLKSMGL